MTTVTWQLKGIFGEGVVSEISVVSDSNIASYRLKISLYLISSRPSLSKCHVDT